MEHKTLNFNDCEIKASRSGDALQFCGYASQFGGVDSYGDTILPGAFAETLKKWGIPKMLYQHDMWSAKVPPGKYLSVVEDTRGLLVEGEFTPGVQLGAEIYAGMKHGTIDGLSIGFTLAKDGYEEQDNGGRKIKTIDRLFEISPVLWPADDAARISEVRSAIEEIRTERDIERVLRDAAHLSREQSKILIAKFRTVLQREAAIMETDEEAIRKTIAAIAAQIGA